VQGSVPFKEESSRRSAANLLTRAEARRLNFASLPGTAAQTVNDAFMSRREIMDREIMGQVLDDLISGDATK
jgi:hypothetical protein